MRQNRIKTHDLNLVGLENMGLRDNWEARNVRICPACGKRYLDLSLFDRLVIWGCFSGLFFLAGYVAASIRLGAL